MALVEILIAIVILGTGFVAILGAMATSILSSEVHRRLASSEVVARDYGERIKAQAIGAPTGPDYRCPGADQLTPTGFTPPPHIRVDPIEVQWWIPDPGRLQQGEWTSTRDTCLEHYLRLCPNDTDVRPECDAGLQRVLITIESDDGGNGALKVATRTQVIVRRANG